MKTHDRIPICLVTGFLGSGKTTLLKHLAAKPDATGLVFLVNEFSPRDIDGALVSSRHPDVISVPGGSIFCKCLVTEFIAKLSDIPKRFARPRGVVIEASGMANPKVMQTMLQETKLDQTYRLARIVSVIDPGSFHKLLHTLPGIRAQIEAADLALMNKSDRFPPDVLAQTGQQLQEIRPGIRILQTAYCQADFTLFPPAPLPHTTGGEYAPCRDPSYVTASFTPDGKIDLQELEQIIEAASEDLYRLKGYATHQDGRTYYIDWTTSGFTSRPATEPHAPAIVLIHKGDPSPALLSLLQFFAARAQRS